MTAAPPFGHKSFLLERIMDDGLIVGQYWTGSRWRSFVWARTKARKPGRCVLTGKSFDKGALVYRPITNATGREVRVRAADAEKLAGTRTATAPSRPDTGEGRAEPAGERTER